ncbi:hypothetical protein BTN49_0986 [Candidatus Enterovibrio escicola]|uniref:Uncharacterized protein n=1 Tax=Candidatus Enterovibrio escicola TaxID=1927127 RepID=A0A2A5T5C1_9GAMM|nr:hypothetical protein BTN49_0986 [Candidatus Enterovibrio escacola]
MVSIPDDTLVFDRFLYQQERHLTATLAVMITMQKQVFYTKKYLLNT